MTDFNTSCLGVCAPIQILNLEMPVNDASLIAIFDKCGDRYDASLLKYSYSVDGVCWSCYMSLDELTESTFNTISDYFVRIKVPGEISEVKTGEEKTTDYTTSLDSSFNLTSSCEQQSPNLYNPYANIDGAVQLQQALSDSVACMVGIPIYYFKTDGVKGAADLTFKEYALNSVTAVKQIKLIIQDGQMPSSKPEFADIGLDWQTDWETEISKSMFATAFGQTAQPTEGDLIYIPMQKRMWTVNESYDEKNGSLMWQSTTWKVALVKYQIDGSLNLNEHDDFVDELVKNKYEDLFGNDEALDSGTDSVQLTKARPANLYSVFKSDSTRKEMTCSSIDFQNTALYHKGTLVTDNVYSFIPAAGPMQIIYQHPYCGSECSVSFIIRCQSNNDYEGKLIEFGHLSIYIKQEKKQSMLTFNVVDKCKLILQNDEWYFVTVRFSKSLRTFDMTASINKHPDNIPLYQLSNWHYFFDVDNCQQTTARWNEEMQISHKKEVSLYGFYGNITNFKMMDVYDDKMSELMMQYPTHQRLLINDTARPLYGLIGTTPK